MADVSDNKNDSQKKNDCEKKDLNARDVLQLMIKLIIVLIITLFLVIGLFTSYSVYKDKKISDFLHNFEYTQDTTILDADNGGNAGYIGGNGDVNIGKNN